MKIVTLSELRAALLAQTTQTWMSVVSVTSPDMRANNDNGEPNPYRIGKGKNATLTLAKITKVNGTIGGKFAQMVTNRAAADVIRERLTAGLPPLDPDALAAAAAARYEQGESWHVPIRDADGEPTFLSVHRDDADDPEPERVYLRFVFKAKGVPDWVRVNDGTPVEYPDVAPWIRANRAPTNQDIERPVIIATYALSSIVEAAFGGERYRVADVLDGLPAGVRGRVLAVADDYIEGERRMHAL